jgi:GxxExxY protein
MRRLSQDEFGEISYEVMRHVFDIHNEIGRYFDESIYKAELANRLPGVLLEQPLDVVFDSFRKRYIVDVLVGEGAIFEFKAVESLVGRHRAQLLNYLLLCNLSHGKLLNIRPEDIGHEFVNTQWELRDRIRFEIDLARWNDAIGPANLPQILVPFLRDVGTGLDIALYEELVTHFFGGKERVEVDVGVDVNGRRVGVQRVRQLLPGVALKITAFDGSFDRFEKHARKLLRHIDLRAIAWVNVNPKQVTFSTLER